MRAKALLLSLGLGLAVSGCGDDDGTDTPTDAGPVDTGAGDTGVDTGTPPADAGMDAGMDAGASTSIEECDPYADPTGCGDGEKCAVVIDRNDPEDVVVLFGCVPASVGTKPAGLVCGRLAADATPDDETDDVVTDECAEGLFCWQAGTSSIARCHPLCGDDRVECETDQYCATLNSEPVFGICTDAEGCDPVFQTGCDDGEGCYLVSNTAGDLLGTCFEFAPPDGGTGAPGEGCMFINNCRPGTQCFPEVFPDGGTGDTVSCRTLCNAGDPIDAGTGAADAGVADAGAVDGGDVDGGDLDAGVPMDAGPVFTGECEGTDECVEIPVEGTAMVPAIPGVCQ